MPQHALGFGGMVSLQAGEQYVGAPGGLGLWVPRLTGSVHHPPQQEKPGAELGVRQAARHRAAVGPTGERVQLLEGDLVAHGPHEAACRDAWVARSARMRARMCWMSRNRSGQ